MCLREVGLWQLLFEVSQPPNWPRLQECIVLVKLPRLPSVFPPVLVFACISDPPVWLTHLPGPAVGCGLFTPNDSAHMSLGLRSGVPAAESCEERGLHQLVSVDIPKSLWKTLALG